MVYSPYSPIVLPHLGHPLPDLDPTRPGPLSDPIPPAFRSDPAPLRPGLVSTMSLSDLIVPLSGPIRSLSGPDPARPGS